MDAIKLHNDVWASSILRFTSIKMEVKAFTSILICF